jgi:hypothetical protein
MAVATDAELKARVEALVDAITSVTLLTGAEAAISRDTLPAAKVKVVGGTREPYGAFKVMVTRTFQVHLFVKEIVQADNLADENVIVEACYPWMETVPDYFRARPSLELNDTGLAFITQPMSDSGPTTLTYAQTSYAGVIYSLPVVVIR